MNWRQKAMLFKLHKNITIFIRNHRFDNNFSTFLTSRLNERPGAAKMTEIEQPPHTNGNDLTVDEDDLNKSRPADIEQDMREMERRKRVEAIMCSRMFREELERIVDGQLKDGPSNILQQISDMMGVPATRVGSTFRGSNCVVPINDIRGVEAMGYEKGEKILRCKLAATYRLLDANGWARGLEGLVTARLNADQEQFLVNPFGLLFHEVTASSLNKVDMQGIVLEQGTTNFGVNITRKFFANLIVTFNFLCRLI